MWTEEGSRRRRLGGGHVKHPRNVANRELTKNNKTVAVSANPRATIDQILDPLSDHQYT